MKTWVIADMHFDSQIWEIKPFKSMTDMNDTIISNWNRLVKEKRCSICFG